MLKKIFLLAPFILFLFACNNDGSKEVDLGDSTPPKIDTPIVYKDTTHLQPAIIDSLALTPEQLKDDSTFANGSEPTAWSVAGIDDPVAFKKFLKKLQIWVKNDQRDSLASVISYPFDKGKIKNAEAFKRNYDKYFTARIKDTLQQQNFSQIFRNYHGAMIGWEGDIWLYKADNGFKISAINN
ncbi:hypothetical protein [Pinibacter soli]|uniref:Uncharacterized protein n=1 Tax=Pinibacter soli TaxID=3044211 RepID=A0ABT6RAY0_9BACT|nr:hypothetical protein [Pinibacter soli]MDI3319606.1 hypothetical protein [Pinibacter soli]